MPQEIERKFLVQSDSWKASVQKSYLISQAYLSTDPARTVRIRIRGAEAFLTIKGKSEGISRLELEYPIPVAEAKQALLLRQSKLIEKTRYEVVHAGKLWEIDVFEGENEGLILAEIELESEDEHFALPDWVGEEVSYDKRYFNAYLSRESFQEWSDRASLPGERGRITDNNGSRL